MNLVVQMGRWTRDPDIRYTNDGKIIARGSLAVNRRFTQDGQPDADFFTVVAFGKTAEFIEKYFRQGMKAVITGELRNNNYTDKDGVKHYNNEILINNIEFAESKRAGESNNTDDTGFINIPEGIDEELPFN